MDEFDRWLLPEGIDEILPGEAMRLEKLRRRIIDLFESWGYNFVMPPLVEYLESFLLNDRDGLQVQTFKLTDQLSGRMLGVRPDITPQIARIDAHSLRGSSINRLCYAGQTLNTRPPGPGYSRSPLQIGAELYGHKGVASNAEVLRLMLEMFRTVGIEHVHLVLGHVGVYTALVEAAGLGKKESGILSDLMRTKAKNEIKSYLDAHRVTPQQRDWFVDLADCYGEMPVLGKARERFGEILPAVSGAFDEIELTAQAIASDARVTLHCDLSEAPGYHYEDGLVFAAFIAGIGQEVARGGRYDGIGEVFGRARPAIGFSGDLKLIAAAAGADEPGAVFVHAPHGDDAGLNDKITEMRRSGTRVVVQLNGDDRPSDHGCTHTLVKQKGKWGIRAL